MFQIKTGFAQKDTTIEERVTILEFQVTDLEEDVTSLEDRTFNVEGELAVISAEQVLQDERILELEMDSDGLYSISKTNE